MKKRRYSRLAVVAAALMGIFGAGTVMASTIPLVSEYACDNSCLAGTGTAQTYSGSTPDGGVSESDTVSSADSSAAPGSETIDVSAASGSLAMGTASWVDELTINGPAGTAGTTGTINLSGTFTVGTTIGGDQADVYLDIFNDPSVSDYTSGSNQSYNVVTTDSPSFSTPSVGGGTAEQVPLSGSFSFTYGQAFILGGDLGIQMGGLGGTGGTGTTTVDGKVAISNLTLPKGATLTSLSNTAYPVSTVPLPAAAWLFGSGLVGLVAVARRKGQSRGV